MNRQQVDINIPVKTIITVVLSLLGLWVIYQIRDIVSLFLIVLILVIAFSPLIQSWERYMPRTLAIIVLYTILLFSILIISALIIPVVLNQLSSFLGYLETNFMHFGFSSDNFIEQLRSNLNLVLQGENSQALTQLFSQFRGSLGTVYSTTLGFLGGIVAVFTVLISSFYLLLEEKNVYRFIQSVVPVSKHKKIEVIIEQISQKLGNYLRGQLLLMAVVGLVTGIALAILGVPYAFLLGVWAGVMELLPYVGPVLGAVPGVFLAFTTLGVVKGMIAIVIYFLVQQIENQFLVPKIMSRALGLSPVVIIFALLIGGKLFGFLGLILAVPVAAVLSVIIQEWSTEVK
jgi:predicted PurR-regulated permease PerM